MRRNRTYDDAKLKVVGINGVACEIHVTPEKGVFYSRVAGTTYRAETLADLERQLRSATRKQQLKVSVPAAILGRQWHQGLHQQGSWIHGHGVQDITLYGLDADGGVKARDDKTGQKLTVRDLWRSDIVRPLTGAEAEEYTRLSKDKSRAEKALDAFEKKVKLQDGAEALVREALNALIDTPAEPEAESEDPR